MPNETFLNLSDVKKKRIDTILINKFYDRHVSQVKVSEIVTEMKMSRGAFYKYFTDLEDAYTYICQKYSIQVHQDILLYIEKNKNDFFTGIEQYLIWCSQLVPDSDYWKGIRLLTSSNTLSNHQRIPLVASDRMIQTWMDILENNHYIIDSKKQGLSFLYFIMDLVMNTLTDFIVNNWSTKELIEDFQFRKKWILCGITKPTSSMD